MMIYGSDFPYKILENNDKLVDISTQSLAFLYNTTDTFQNITVYHPSKGVVQLRIKPNNFPIYLENSYSSPLYNVFNYNSNEAYFTSDVNYQVLEDGVVTKITDSNNSNPVLPEDFKTSEADLNFEGYLVYTKNDIFLYKTPLKFNLKNPVILILTDSSQHTRKDYRLFQNLEDISAQTSFDTAEFIEYKYYDILLPPSIQYLKINSYNTFKISSNVKEVYSKNFSILFRLGSYMQNSSEYILDHVYTDQEEITMDNRDPYFFGDIYLENVSKLTLPSIYYYNSYTYYKTQNMLPKLILKTVPELIYSNSMVSDYRWSRLKIRVLFFKTKELYKEACKKYSDITKMFSFVDLPDTTYYLAEEVNQVTIEGYTDVIIESINSNNIVFLSGVINSLTVTDSVKYGLQGLYNVSNIILNNSKCIDINYGIKSTSSFILTNSYLSFDRYDISTQNLVLKLLNGTEDLYYKWFTFLSNSVTNVIVQNSTGNNIVDSTVKTYLPSDPITNGSNYIFISSSESDNYLFNNLSFDDALKNKLIGYAYSNRSYTIYSIDTYVIVMNKSDESKVTLQTLRPINYNLSTFNTELKNPIKTTPYVASTVSSDIVAVSEDSVLYKYSLNSNQLPLGKFRIFDFRYYGSSQDVILTNNSTELSEIELIDNTLRFKIKNPYGTIFLNSSYPIKDNMNTTTFSPNIFKDSIYAKDTEDFVFELSYNLNLSLSNITYTLSTVNEKNEEIVRTLFLPFNQTDRVLDDKDSFVPLDKVTYPYDLPGIFQMDFWKLYIQYKDKQTVLSLGAYKNTDDINYLNYLGSYINSVFGETLVSEESSTYSSRSAISDVSTLTNETSSDIYFILEGNPILINTSYPENLFFNLPLDTSVQPKKDTDAGTISFILKGKS